MPPLSTDYIFMSYSRRDDAVMRRIVAFLREQGIKVWVDNEKLIPGTPVWEKEIEKAVQGASAVVVVLSPDSKDSEWVRREISLADQYEKRVFPLLVRGDEKTSISIRLIGRQYVDIRSNEDAGLNYVSATLLRYLEELNEREQNAKKETDRLAAQKIKTEKRLAARKAEEERIALEKIATERKAKEDADRLIAQKADEERVAFEKIESDRKAKEDADRLASQKAEEERIALEKEVADRKAKEDADRISAQKAELDSKEKLARENAEREAREKLAREKMERDSREKAKAASTIEKPVVTKFETKKQSGTKLPLWGIGLIAFSVFALIVWGLSSLPASPKANPTSVATQTPIVPGTPTLFVKPATETLVTPTSTPQPTETLIFILQPTETLMPTSAYKVGDTEISPKDGMILLYVPAGKFLMGSTDTDALAESNEKPQHTVTLDAYWIDQTDVTNAMYTKCVSAGKCRPPRNTRNYGNSNYANHPVVYVSWIDALAYCSWAERRLPTEAEWEEAARGTDGRIYPWGNNELSADFLNAFSLSDSDVSDTTEVGKYPNGKSVYGAYDMAGNVWQWVSDWYSDTYYQSSPSSNPLGPDTGQYRVLRGGSWANSWNVARSAFRSYLSPGYTENYIGFRCARSP